MESIVGVIALAVGLARLALALYDRRHDKPVVIAHEERPRHFCSGVLQTAWVVDAYLTGEGKQDAFNARFGVQMHGIRFAYRMRPEDPGSGNRQRVIKAGERRPEKGAWPILIPQTTIWGGKGDPDPGRIYWCRYEDADGRVFESLNPGDRSRNMKIRRLRLVRSRERLEEWRRRRADKDGEARMRDMFAELRQAAEEIEAAKKSPQPT